MKRIILILLFAAVAHTASAQVTITDTERGTAIALGEELDRRSVTRLSGAPCNVESHDDEAFGGQTTTYIYPDAWFMTLDGILTCFGICGPRYELTVLNTCRVRTGNRLPDFLAKLPQDKIRRYLDKNTLKIYIHYDEALIIETDSEGIIKCLVWHVPA